ncbi:receptor-like protein 12 [Morus notabilis]|nr:receptor-like protein 12 [Morus notabilis]
MFSKMRRLAQLGLADNKLSLVFGERNTTNGTTLPQFKILGLSSCNISEFPHFLRHQNELRFLDLSKNSIHGQVPKWIWNTSVQTLLWVNISNNFITGFQNPPTAILHWARLQVVDLHSNMLQGQLLIPLSSIEYVDVSNNMLSGEISPLICNLSSIEILDLSQNNFSGTVPHCLGSLSSSLFALNLRNNSFHGIIPLAIEKASNLLMIDFSHNQFQGKLPRSLAICTMLEYLDFSNNQLIDVFPTWLGTLPRLKVIFLQKNGFYGAIQRAKNTSEFPNLHIIDISNNSFSGALPCEYIFIWNGRKTFEMSNSTYMNAGVSIQVGPKDKYLIYYNYATTLVTKSVETYYGKIREELAVINLSSNKFSGEIPEFVGNLIALHSLNLSNNMLTGRIPLSVKGLSKLESLDLSRNMLSGEIPQQLTQLNFLQSFNVSHNNLTGPIPQGDQLRTFDQSSFEGNLGLCGDPLPKKCGDSEALQPTPSADKEDDDSGSPIQLDWKVVLAGSISGFIVGVALEDVMMTKRHGWFIRAFRRGLSRMEI